MDAPKPAPAKVATFAPTDIGNATILRGLHGDRLRHIHDRRLWRVWSGSHWADDTTGLAYDLTFDVFRDRVLRAEEIRDAKLRREEQEAACAAGTHARRKAMLASAANDDGIAARSEDFDRDPFLLNCVNGMVDLCTGELRPHDRAAMISRLAPVAYDPEATCSRWDRFLREVLLEEEVIAFAGRLAGYLLTGDISEQAAFFLLGKGANGKSVFAETLRALLGNYVADTPLATFADRYERHTSDLASFVGARLVTASEVKATHVFNELLLKRLTGGDPITCRPLYRDFFTYTPVFKLLFLVNDLPKLSAHTYALRRRVRVIPFRQTFYSREEGRTPVREEGLRETLRGELPGILTWAVRGCLEWQRVGLGAPASVALETAAQLDRADPLADFLAEKCFHHPQAQVQTGRLWRAYLTWCTLTRTPPAFKSAVWLARHLASRDGIEASRTGSARFLLGLGLESDQGMAALALASSQPAAPRRQKKLAADPALPSHTVTPEAPTPATVPS